MRCMICGCHSTFFYKVKKTKDDEQQKFICDRCAVLNNFLPSEIDFDSSEVKK